MSRFDASNAELFVFTFKEGVLAAMGHDLKLRVGRFHVELNQTVVEAEADAHSLEVVCARKGAFDAHGVLPAFAFSEIRQRVAEEVLHSTLHPKIRFDGRQLSETRVAGQLTLHGVSQQVEVSARNEGDLTVASLTIDQRQFGIAPYRGLMGALKVKPLVRLELRVRQP
jgi:hypothetical protein